MRKGVIKITVLLLVAAATVVLVSMQRGVILL